MTARPQLRFDAVDAGLLADLAERNARPVTAVPTPFAQWNRACRDEGGGRGLARGWHIVVAGATGAGKSCLALNLVDAALRAGQHVLYISLEMSRPQLVTRLVALSTGTAVRHLEPGEFYRRTVAETAHGEFCAMLERSGGSIHVNQLPLRELADISLAINWYAHPGTAGKVRPPCTVIVTDYLQLCWASGARTMLDSITEVSHLIRGLAREHELVSIGLSQFNRSTSVNRAERPRVEGLMGGSPLENDADQVLLLDHSSHERNGPGTARTNVLLAKNRHGPQVEIPVTWDYRTLRVREDTPDPDPDEAARAEMRSGA